MTQQVVASQLTKAKDAIRALDLGQKWTGLLSKDVPAEIMDYVVNQAKDGKHLDDIRSSLGITSGTDQRWRKIMTGIRAAKRVDATGVFVKWLERNERFGDKLNVMLNDMMENKIPISKTLLQALTTMSQLQLNTVKLGKELGVFVDPAERGGQGGQGVTIVVQTNVPSPEKEAIVIHQQTQNEKNRALLEQHRK